MLKEAFKLDKGLDAENIAEYFDYELTQPGFVAKIRRYAKKCFLIWFGLEPPLQFANFRATRTTALALFFVHISYVFADLIQIRPPVSINQTKPFTKPNGRQAMYTQ